MENFINVQIDINAPKERVWDALINPEVTKQYMFGCRVTTNWEPGHIIDWVGFADGKEITYVTGKVLSYEPFHELSYTVIDPTASYPHTPENHLIVTCTLTEKDDVTTLAISQGDYSKVAEGDKRYGEGSKGWEDLLRKIKDLVESSIARQNT